MKDEGGEWRKRIRMAISKRYFLRGRWQNEADKAAYCLLIKLDAKPKRRSGGKK